MRLTKLLNEFPSIKTSGQLTEVAKVHEVNAFTSLLAQVSSMSSIVKNFTANRFNNNLSGQQPSQFENTSCVYCRNGNMFENCLSNPKSICYIGNQNQSRSGLRPQSNFYNPLWRNHPNLLWSNQWLVLETPIYNPDQTNHQDFCNKFRNLHPLNL
ncbi:hypothetical protein EPI10_030988 [Gossypium australe]|uniref:Uncharacterized protein n=1 Tax=Gossypium australe TaxID=47621 RepID=A0A5B6X042_9ROSI|nr:hypothetical protein EPI10_030988 [Gossypium australe]